MYQPRLITPRELEKKFLKRLVGRGVFKFKIKRIQNGIEITTPEQDVLIFEKNYMDTNYGTNAEVILELDNIESKLIIKNVWTNPERGRNFHNIIKHNEQLLEKRKTGKIISNNSQEV